MNAFKISPNPLSIAKGEQEIVDRWNDMGSSLFRVPILEIFRSQALASTKNHYYSIRPQIAGSLSTLSSTS